MICPIGKRPALLIGPRHQVLSYDTSWIGRALRRAAVAAGRADFPCTDDLCVGIIHYLENNCPLNLLPIEDLYVRIERMLRRIELGAIADHLTVLSPPVTLSLMSTIKDTGFGFELGFYQALQTELEELRSYGVEKIRITDLRATVLHLRGQRRWTRNCTLLASEIETFIGRFITSRDDAPLRDITLSLETTSL